MLQHLNDINHVNTSPCHGPASLETGLLLGQGTNPRDPQPTLITTPHLRDNSDSRLRDNSDTTHHHLRDSAVADIPVPIHTRYGGPLPDLLCMRLEENIAEKVARLNRRTLARDAYDLVWISSTPGHNLDRALTRRLAVLKCWVDLHGLTTATSTWNPLPEARPFDTTRWLQPRRQRDFDDENIGLLTTPPPDLDTLGNELANRYQWLADLDDDERTIANGAATDRTTVLRMLAALEGKRLNGLAW